MLRRWVRSYIEWDERTHRRLLASRRFAVGLLLLLWAALIAVPVVTWWRSRQSGRPLAVTLPVAIVVAGAGGVVTTRFAFAPQRAPFLDPRPQAGHGPASRAG